MFKGHGDDRQFYPAEIQADFSTNVYAGPEPKGLKEHLFKHWELINRYPQVLGEHLAGTIARHHGLDAANILVTNGTTESIYLIAERYRYTTTTILIPAFSEYEDACRRQEHTLNFIPYTHAGLASVIDTRLCFICHPNNPDGAVLTGLPELIASLPDTLFVIDEAFIEFTLEASSLTGRINEFNNLIVLRSMTKAYAIPGLRLGYIAASAKLIEALQQLKFPWSVNALALEAGEFIFNGYDSFQLPLESILKEKVRFIARLTELGVEIAPGATHFFLAKLPEKTGTAADLKTFLIEHHGILIRDAANFRSLDPGHFRLATLDRSKNNLLVNALQAWKSSYI